MMILLLFIVSILLITVSFVTINFMFLDCLSMVDLELIIGIINIVLIATTPLVFAGIGELSYRKNWSFKLRSRGNDASRSCYSFCDISNYR